jgi:hypothetical protein
MDNIYMLVLSFLTNIYNKNITNENYIYSNRKATIDTQVKMNISFKWFKH